MRALTIRQPHAEAIMRGITSTEFRIRPTRVRGRIYIYTSDARYHPEQEATILEMYGMGDVNADDLPYGFLIGTVELWDCTGLGGKYEWHFRNPERATELVQPAKRPGAIWFDPF